MVEIGNIDFFYISWVVYFETSWYEWALGELQEFSSQAESKSSQGVYSQPSYDVNISYCCCSAWLHPCFPLLIECIRVLCDHLCHSAFCIPGSGSGMSGALTNCSGPHTDDWRHGCCFRLPRISHFYEDSTNHQESLQQSNGEPRSLYELMDTRQVW